MSGELNFEKLRILAYKLRCLGYLVETQDPNHVQPVDFDEAQYGLALFLNVLFFLRWDEICNLSV